MQQQQVKGEMKRYLVDKYQIAKVRVICGGLIIISVYFIQQFLSIGVFNPPPSKALDGLALASVSAFAAALPLLVMRVLFSFEEGKRRETIEHKWHLEVAYWFGVGIASLGIVLAFFHIHWLAGLFILASMGFGSYVYISYTNKLTERDGELFAKWGIKNKKEETSEG